MKSNVVVHLFTRPTIDGKRQWIEVNPKHKYPVGTVFILRWLPEGGTNYKTKTLGKMGLHLAKIACASFEAKDEAETKPVEKPKTLVEFRTAFLKDKDAALKKDGSPLDADTNRVSAVPHDVEPSCWRRDFVGASEAGPAENMNAKSKIGLVVGAVAGSLLFDFLALSKDWPTPGAYLIEWLFHPGAVPDVKTDLRIVWAVDAGVFVATNFLCCLAIFYVVYLMLRKRL